MPGVLDWKFLPMHSFHHTLMGVYTNKSSQRSWKVILPSYEPVLTYNDKQFCQNSLSSFTHQAGTKCLHRSCTQLPWQCMISRARSFSLNKIVICFDSCKILLLTYLSQKKMKRKEKVFKILSHSLFQATVVFYSLKYSSSNYCWNVHYGGKTH